MHTNTQSPFPLSIQFIQAQFHQMKIVQVVCVWSGSFTTLHILFTEAAFCCPLFISLNQVPPTVHLTAASKPHSPKRSAPDLLALGACDLVWGAHSWMTPQSPPQPEASHRKLVKPCIIDYHIDILSIIQPCWCHLNFSQHLLVLKTQQACSVGSIPSIY